MSRRLELDPLVTRRVELVDELPVAHAPMAEQEVEVVPSIVHDQSLGRGSDNLARSGSAVRHTASRNADAGLGLDIPGGGDRVAPAPDRSGHGLPGRG
jgi:hypothetical protein